MKTTTSLISNLLLLSLLFLGVSTVEANEPAIKEAANLSFYCHMQFPEMREDTLSWDRPVLDTTAGNVVDFYGACDHDPTGIDEIKAQRRVLLRGFHDDGE
jgi:hypothetical protein